MTETKRTAINDYRGIPLGLVKEHSEKANTIWGPEFFVFVCHDLEIEDIEPLINSIMFSQDFHSAPI